MADALLGLRCSPLVTREGAFLCLDVRQGFDFARAGGQPYGMNPRGAE